MKKIIAAILVLLMIFALASCKKDPELPEDITDPETSDSETIGEDETADPEGDKAPDEEKEDENEGEKEDELNTDEPGEDIVLPPENVDISDIPEVDEEIIVSLENVNFLEEENRYVFTVNGVKHIYCLEGDNVISYETYIDKGSEEAAEGMLTGFKGIMDMGVENAPKAVSRTGTVVYVEYNPISFAYTTRAEVKAAYDAAVAGN